MISRLLPQSEWARLQTTSVGDLWQQLDPAFASVLVVEDEDRLLGACVVLTVLHPECFWVADDHRHSGRVAWRLWEGIQAMARGFKMRTVAGAAISDEMRDLLQHLGAERLPGDHYVLPVKES